MVVDFERDDDDDDFLFFRDIPIRSDLFDTCVRKWSLFCRQADKFLTISRDRLLPQGEDWCQKTWDVLSPDILRLVYPKLLEVCKEACENNDDNKHSLQYQYYWFCRGNWILPNPINVDYQPLDDYELDKEHFFKLNGDAVTAKQLFETKAAMVYVRGVVLEEEKYVVVDRSKLLNDFKNNSSLSKDLVCCNNTYIGFSESFVCSRIVFAKHSKVYILKANIEAPQFVEIDTNDIKAYYDDFHYGLLYGLKEYKKIVVGKEYAPQLGYSLPNYGNCWIYPMPVRNAKYIDADGNIIGREKMRLELEKGYIKELVPEYLVKLIQKYNALKNDKLTADEIYNEYIRLILDAHYGYSSPD